MHVCACDPLSQESSAQQFDQVDSDRFGPTRPIDSTNYFSSISLVFVCFFYLVEYFEAPYISLDEFSHNLIYFDVRSVLFICDCIYYLFAYLFIYPAIVLFLLLIHLSCMMHAYMIAYYYLLMYLPFIILIHVYCFIYLFTSAYVVIVIYIIIIDD